MYSPPCCGELLAQQDGEAPGADGEEGEGEAGEHTAQLQVQPGGHLHTLDFINHLGNRPLNYTSQRRTWYRTS